MPQDGPQSSKKPYTTPTLVTYGDVRKITESHSFGFIRDGRGAERTF